MRETPAIEGHSEADDSPFGIRMTFELVAQHTTFDACWLARSRGGSAEEIDTASQSLSSKGLVVGDELTAAAVALRQHIEDDTDRLSTLPWRLLGRERSLAFARDFEPPCEKLLERVDLTAGPNYQPASRLR
jgi:helix-turn-helix protein